MLYLDVFNAYCYDYWIDFNSFLFLLVNDDDTISEFYLFFLEVEFFMFVGDFRLFIEGVLLRVSIGTYVSTEYGSSVWQYVLRKSIQLSEHNFPDFPIFIPFIIIVITSTRRSSYDFNRLRLTWLCFRNYIGFIIYFNCKMYNIWWNKNNF